MLCIVELDIVDPPEDRDSLERGLAGKPFLFVDEDIDFARRLVDATVATELQVVPGAFHGFDVIAPQAAVVRQFRHAQFAALARSFGYPPGKVTV